MRRVPDPSRSRFSTRTLPLYRTRFCGMAQQLVGSKHFLISGLPGRSHERFHVDMAKAGREVLQLGSCRFISRLIALHTPMGLDVTTHHLPTCTSVSSRFDLTCDSAKRADARLDRPDLGTGRWVA